MKNYPNQASTFARIRATLELVAELSAQGSPLDPDDDGDLGYEMVRRGMIRFRDLPNPTPGELAARIAVEQTRRTGDQPPRTTARELRRTLRDLGWLRLGAVLTRAGRDLLATAPDSVDEQALLVQGLLGLVVTNKDGTEPHHPIPVMLKLLAVSPSRHRTGLELILEPRSDSDAEFQRVRELYLLPADQRIQQLGITKTQRDNAVKIFPTLAVTAGLVVEDDDGYFSLSQDGWRVAGQAPAVARRSISRRRGRRTTVGKLVTSKSIAARHSRTPPKSLTAEEQARAAEKLRERTDEHQKLVKRFAALIGDGHGEFFEDEFSYDLLWVPKDVALPGYLFEMKTISGDADAYTQVRRAVGQLSYYDYFYVAPTLSGRGIVRGAVFAADIPDALTEYLEHDEIGAIVYPVGGTAKSVNSRGQKVLAALPQNSTEP